MITETKFFKTLDPLKQQLVQKRVHRLEIEHGIELSKNLGFDNYCERFNPQPMYKGLVKELLEMENKA